MAEDTEQVLDNLEESPQEEAPEETDEEQETPPSGAEEGVDLNTLNQRLTELETANKGLKKTISAERGKRQQSEGRLQQITETISQARERKRQQAEQPEEQPQPQDLDVAFRENGTPYIPQKQLQELAEQYTKPQVQELQNQVKQLYGEMLQTKGTQQSVQRVENLMREDKDYPAAMETVKKQYKYLDDTLTEYVRENGIEVKSVDQAIDLIQQSGIAGQFDSQFPGADWELTIEALTTPNMAARDRKLRKALAQNKPSEQEAPPAQGMNKTLKKLAKKPSNLSNVRNQQVSGEFTLDKIGSLSPDDILEVYDETLDKQLDLADKELEEMEG